MPADIATPRPPLFSSSYLDLTPLGATRRLAPTSTSMRRYVSTPLCSSSTVPRRLPASHSAALEFDSDSDTSSLSSAQSTPLPPTPSALPLSPDSREPSPSPTPPAFIMSRGRAVPIGGVAMQRTSGSLGSDGNPFALKQEAKRQRERGLSDPPSPSTANVRALRPAASVMTIRTVEWTA